MVRCSPSSVPERSDFEAWVESCVDAEAETGTEDRSSGRRLVEEVPALDSAVSRETVALLDEELPRSPVPASAVRGSSLFVSWAAALGSKKLMKDVKARAPNAICEMTSTNLQINLLVNRVNPPFDDPEIRKAMSLALDRKAFNSILFEGSGRLGGAMQAKPEGEWGMPQEILSTLMGYGPDTEKNLADAQVIMQKLGYSDAKPLSIERYLGAVRAAPVLKEANA